MAGLWTLQDLADHLQIPVASLYRQRYFGEEPGSLGFRCGRHVRFDPADIKDWERRRKLKRRGAGQRQLTDPEAHPSVRK